MFSRRAPESLEPNAWARLRAAKGTIPFDLTVSNPTACGIPYPHDLLDPLADAAALSYRPRPFGLDEARGAIASLYEARGTAVDPGRVVLTASSSEAYSVLFKLLCDPGDAVLVPAPSYPLFEHLATLDAVRATPWPLDAIAGWQPVLETTPPKDVKAAIVVHPNNPTGSIVVPSHADRLVRACREAGIALIADEVFLDYPLADGPPLESFAASTRCLTFTLGGLSKSVGLPQLKLSWIVVSGPQAEVAPALRRLEYIADSYLSVGTPVQIALARLLEHGAAVRDAILARCRRNLAALDEAVSRAPTLALTRPAGGWSAAVRFPAIVDEESLVLDLLDRDGVAVHPGYFFDFPTPGWIVVSLLPEPAAFDGGLTRVLSRISPAT